MKPSDGAVRCLREIVRAPDFFSALRELCVMQTQQSLDEMRAAVKAGNLHEAAIAEGRSQAWEEFTSKLKATAT